MESCGKMTVGMRCCSVGQLCRHRYGVEIVCVFVIIKGKRFRLLSYHVCVLCCVYQSAKYPLIQCLHFTRTQFHFNTTSDMNTMYFEKANESVHEMSKPPLTFFTAELLIMSTNTSHHINPPAAIKVNCRSLVSSHLSI